MQYFIQLWMIMVTSFFEKELLVIHNFLFMHLNGYFPCSINILNHSSMPVLQHEAPSCSAF